MSERVCGEIERLEGGDGECGLGVTGMLRAGDVAIYAEVVRRDGMRIVFREWRLGLCRISEDMEWRVLQYI